MSSFLYFLCCYKEKNKNFGLIRLNLDQNQKDIESELVSWNRKFSIDMRNTGADVPLQILMSYSGKYPQKQPSIGNLQKKGSEKNKQNSRKNTFTRASFFLF